MAEKPLYFYRGCKDMKTMCGADLSDLKEEVPKGKEDDPRKKTGQDKSKEKKP